MLLTEFAPLQNRFAPLPMGLHIGFAVAATILFTVIYLRTKKLSNILWLLICDATVILQFYSDSVTVLAVGICEVLLIGMLIWQVNKEKKADKALCEAAAAKLEPDPAEDIEELEQIVKAERKAIIDDNKVDVIGDAFDGEDSVK